MLAVTLAALLGASLSVGIASATPRPNHGLQIKPQASPPLNPRTGLPVGTMPTRSQLNRVATVHRSMLRTAATQAATSTKYHLTYYGGPVVSNVQVQPVQFGSGGYIPQIASSTAPSMQTFFQSIASSPYMGMLSEYSTPSQTIGAGSVAPMASITPTTMSTAPGSTVYNAQLQQELFDQIFNDTGSQLYQPTLNAPQLANTAYTLYFPAGVTICQDSPTTACSNNTFCGYHASFDVVDNSTQAVLANVRYIVLPDPTTSNWLGGCSSRNATTYYTAVQSVASHELAEVITDPEVGSQTAWYDASNSASVQDPGEIADICDDAQYPNQSTQYTGLDSHAYVVQNVWSNHRNACVPAVPTVSATAPFTLTTAATIAYGGGDTNASTGITYDVAYKAARWNGSWGPLTTLVHGTAATKATLPVRPGMEYCVVVRAHDSLGIVSGWSSPRCTASPLDDASLSTKTAGWNRSRASAAYHGTVTRTGKAGSKLAVGGAIANRLGLLVATCPTCGNVQIYLGNTLWKTISTKSSSWHYKHLVLPDTFGTRTTGIVIRVASGLAVIDGLGVSRPAPAF